MLLYHIKELAVGILLLMLFFFICAASAYIINARRPADDPNKHDYSLGAVFLAPVTWPLFIGGSIFLFMIKALVYGVFLILFTIALVIFRKPFLLVWLNKTVLWIGDRLLEANTFLIRITFGSWVNNPQTT